MASTSGAESTAATRGAAAPASDDLETFDMARFLQHSFPLERRVVEGYAHAVESLKHREDTAMTASKAKELIAVVTAALALLQHPQYTESLYSRTLFPRKDSSSTTCSAPVGDEEGFCDSPRVEQKTPACQVHVAEKFEARQSSLLYCQGHKRFELADDMVDGSCCWRLRQKSLTEKNVNAVLKPLLKRLRTRAARAEARAGQEVVEGGANSSDARAVVREASQSDQQVAALEASPVALQPSQQEVVEGGANSSDARAVVREASQSDQQVAALQASPVALQPSQQEEVTGNERSTAVLAELEVGLEEQLTIARSYHARSNELEAAESTADTLLDKALIDCRTLHARLVGLKDEAKAKKRRRVPAVLLQPLDGELETLNTDVKGLLAMREKARRDIQALKDAVRQHQPVMAEKRRSLACSIEELKGQPGSSGSFAQIHELMESLNNYFHVVMVEQQAVALHGASDEGRGAAVPMGALVGALSARAEAMSINAPGMCLLFRERAQFCSLLSWEKGRMRVVLRLRRPLENESELGLVVKADDNRVVAFTIPNAKVEFEFDAVLDTTCDQAMMYREPYQLVESFFTGEEASRDYITEGRRVERDFELWLQGNPIP